MKVVEYTGIDIDEALINASEDLGLTADNIEFEIVTLGSKGLFGIGKKPAKIKVFLRKEKEGTSFIKGKEKKAKPDFKKKKKERKEHRKKKERKEQQEQPKKKEEKARRERPAKREKPQQQERPTKKEARKERREEAVKWEPSPENMKKIEEFVLFVAKRLDESIVVTSVESDNAINITIKTDNTGKLIGKGGRVINSLEYLTMKFARKLYDARVKVIIQIDGERKNR